MRPLFSLALLSIMLITPHNSAWGYQTEKSASFCDNSEWQSYFTETDYVCVPAENGIAIAPVNNAALYAQNIDDGAAIFQEHFNIPLRPMAVIIAAEISIEQSDFLTEHGFHIMPWLNETAKQQQKKSAIVKQIEEQTAALPPDVRDQAIAKAMSQLGLDKDIKKGPPDARELGALAHEIGHVWFKEWYNDGIQIAPNSAKTGSPVYGSNAADWLDETAAILSENDFLKKQRRQSMHTLFDPESGQLKIGLQTYMSMEHPLLNAVQKTLLSKNDAERLTNGPKTKLTGKMVKTKTSRIIKLSGEEAKEFLAANTNTNAIEFYVQTRALADFLIEKTGDKHIIFEIATHIRDGGTFKTWLMKTEPQYGFPATEDGFSQQWQQWMREKITV